MILLDKTTVELKAISLSDEYSTPASRSVSKMKIISTILNSFFPPYFVKASKELFV